MGGCVAVAVTNTGISGGRFASDGVGMNVGGAAVASLSLILPSLTLPSWATLKRRLAIMVVAKTKKNNYNANITTT